MVGAGNSPKGIFGELNEETEEVEIALTVDFNVSKVTSAT
jgi:hypothetical protein